MVLKNMVYILQIQFLQQKIMLLNLKKIKIIWNSVKNWID
jgi:hypothetical protein